MIFHCYITTYLYKNIFACQTSHLALKLNSKLYLLKISLVHISIDNTKYSVAILKKTQLILIMSDLSKARLELRYRERKILFLNNFLKVSAEDSEPLDSGFFYRLALAPDPYFF